MINLQKYLPASLALALLLALALTGCSSQRQEAQNQGWHATDQSCKVVDMRYVCLRQCQHNETGPSGAMCINRNTTQNDAYCDCGTRTMAPVAGTAPPLQ